jgi:hypothetical protein
MYANENIWLSLKNGWLSFLTAPRTIFSLHLKKYICRKGIERECQPAEDFSVVQQEGSREVKKRKSCWIKTKAVRNE